MVVKILSAPHWVTAIYLDYALPPKMNYFSYIDCKIVLLETLSSPDKFQWQRAIPYRIVYCATPFRKMNTRLSRAEVWTGLWWEILWGVYQTFYEYSTDPTSCSRYLSFIWNIYLLPMLCSTVYIVSSSSLHPYISFSVGCIVDRYF